MKHEGWLVLGSLAVASGCASEPYLVVHASSLEGAAPADSQLTVQRPAAETTAALLQLLEKRGFHVVNRVDAPSRATYLIFKGDRQSFASTHGEATAVGVGNVAVAESSSVERSSSSAPGTPRASRPRGIRLGSS